MFSRHTININPEFQSNTWIHRENELFTVETLWFLFLFSRYTAPRIDLIPEQQERYQVIENLMLLQNSMRKGKEILRQFRHQRSSSLTLPYKNLFYLSLYHLLSSTTRIPNPRPNQVCCTVFIVRPPLSLYRCILKKVLCLGREPPRRTLSSETF